MRRRSSQQKHQLGAEEVIRNRKQATIAARVAQRAERRAAGVVVPPPAPKSPESYDQVQLRGYTALRRVFSQVPEKTIVETLHAASDAPTEQRPIIAARTLLAQPAPASPALSARPGGQQLVRTATVVPAQAVPPIIARTVTAGGTATRTLQPAPAPDAAMDPAAGKVPGLLVWLRAMGLESHREAVVEWAEEQGAAHLEELVENVEDLAKALPEVARHTLRIRAAEVAAAMKTHAFTPLGRVVSVPATPLTRHNSMLLQQPLPGPMIPLAPADEPVNDSGLQGTASARSGLARASSSESSWYVPLDRSMSWDAMSHREMKRTNNALPRYYTPPKHRWRVDPQLLKQRIPSPAELSAIEDAQKRAADKRNAWNAASENSMADPKKEEEMPLSSFQAMQDAFLARHGDAIQKDLGPGATLNPAPIATHLQNQILGTAQRAGAVPDFGYHGTAEKNYNSIFSQGLRIPGHGGVNVVHGSAHGVGIYTAMPGAPMLSQGFVPSGDSDLLVVGVVEQTPKRQQQQQQPTATLGKSKQHRDHHKPAASAAPQFINGRKVHSDTGAIRHVGDARVIFDEERVMPLFVAKGGAHRDGVVGATVTNYQQVVSGPLFGAAADRVNKAPVQRAGADQVVVIDSGETLWRPPEESRGWNEIRVKRRVVAKERYLQRVQQRKAKAPHEET